MVDRIGGQPAMTETTRATAKNVLKLPDGKYPVAPNLNLVVRGNSRAYVLRYTLGGKRREKSLGSAYKISLSEAKELAEKLRVELKDGLIPETPKEKLDREIKRKEAETFGSYAIRVIERIAEVRAWKNAKHRSQWFNTVKTYALPVIGDKTVSSVTRQDILSVIRPIWYEKNETASRLRQRLEMIFSYAITDGLADSNPATWRGNLDRELPPPSKVNTREHLTAMPLSVLQDKVACFMPPNNRTRQVILFTILTASRVGESALARWSEIDWDNKVWTVPPERRKDGKPYPHRVPLSEQALEVLRAVEPKGDMIFCHTKNKVGSAHSLTKLLKKMTGEDATMHGFRSTFRDWCAENGVPDIVAEKCLMHATGNAVVQAYQRSDLLEQRREVMQKWADTVFKKLGRSHRA